MTFRSFPSCFTRKIQISDICKGKKPLQVYYSHTILQAYAELKLEETTAPLKTSSRHLGVD